MINESKYSDELQKNTNFSDLNEIVLKYADDLISEDTCLKILEVKQSEIIDNIKEINIKYTNKNNENVIRRIKVEISKIIRHIPKGVYDRQNIKPFGKAVNTNNKATLDKIINIDKPINKIKENNETSIQKKKENLDIKKKYTPPKLTNNNSIPVFKKYKPPTRREGNVAKLPQYKMKIDNLSYDVTVDDIKDLCSEFGEIINCFIPKYNYGNNKGKSKGFAILKFSNKNSMEECLININNRKYENMILKAEKI